MEELSSPLEMGLLQFRFTAGGQTVNVTAVSDTPAGM